MKLKELRSDFYAYSSKTSDIFRQLSLAGIAIVWIFKKDDTSANKYITNLSPELIGVLKYFIWALALDFFHAFIPSIIYGLKVEIEDSKKTDDETVLNLFKWTIPTCFFYVSKIIFMIIGYFSLFEHFILK